MKLNKEQIAFAVIILIVAWLSYNELSSGGAKVKKRKGRGRRMASQVVPLSELDTLKAALIDESETTWTLAGRNIFRAPKEHVPMPPLNLTAPPRPTLVTSSPQMIPGLDPYSRMATVAQVLPVLGVDLPARSEEAGSGNEIDAEEADDTTTGNATGEADVNDDDEPVPEFDPTAANDQEEKRKERKKKRELKKILGLRERLAQDAEAKIAKARAERQKLKDIAERERTLDKIHWLSGEIWYGSIENDSVVPEGADGLDKYDIKLKIDAIRKNTSASPAERTEQLGNRKLEIEFRRWKDQKWAAKSKLAPLNVQAIEFAEGATPGIYTVAQFELDRRLLPADSIEEHIKLSAKLAEIGEFGLAKTHLLRYAENGHSSLLLYRSLALAANRDFDYDIEMKAVHDGLKVFPKDAVLLAGAAELYSRLGLERLATELFDRAEALAPRNPIVNARYGRHLVTAHQGGRARVIEAQQLLEKASSGRFELEHERRAVLLDLGEARLAAGKIDGAARAFDQVSTAEPDNVRALIGLASVDFAKGDMDAAKDRLKNALERAPSNGLAYYNMALCSLAKEEWVQARDGFFDAMNADPLLTARAHCGLGYLHERVGDKAAAQAAYAAALVADPEDGEVLYWNGRGFLLVEDYQQAYDILRRAQSKLPNQFDILAALSEACFHLQRFDDALRYLDSAMVLRPQSPGLLVRKAQTLVRLRRFDDAKKCLDQSKQQKDTDEVELSLAYYYYLEGNHEEALKRFRTVERSLSRRDESPLAVYTRKFAADIADNLSKKVWSDHFNRVATGRDLLRGWRSYAPGSGIPISLVNNRVTFTGTQKASDVPSCIFQRRRGREFVSFEAGLVAKPDADVICGIGIFTFRKNTANQNPFVDVDSGGIAYDGMMVGKNREGRLAIRKISRYQMGRWEAIPETWPALVDGKPQQIVLGIASESGKKGTFTVLVNGDPVLTGIEIKGLRRTTKDLQLWAFTQAEIDRRVDVQVDDVRIVTRDSKRR